MSHDSPTTPQQKNMQPPCSLSIGAESFSGPVEMIAREGQKFFLSQNSELVLMERVSNRLVERSRIEVCPGMGPMGPWVHDISVLDSTVLVECDSRIVVLSLGDNWQLVIRDIINAFSFAFYSSHPLLASNRLILLNCNESQEECSQRNSVQQLAGAWDIAIDEDRAFVVDQGERIAIYKLDELEEIGSISLEGSRAVAAAQRAVFVVTDNGNLYVFRWAGTTLVESQRIPVAVPVSSEFFSDLRVSDDHLWLFHEHEVRLFLIEPRGRLVFRARLEFPEISVRDLIPNGATDATVAGPFGVREVLLENNQCQPTNAE